MKLTLKHAAAAIILVSSFASSVAAGPFEDAVAAHERGDYATALRLFRQQAEQVGNPTAAFNLGLMYFSGKGVPQSNLEAMKWFGIAAVQGDPQAQFNLRLAYERGVMPQNYAEAVKWYRLAADQGLAAAQYNLGLMYAQGLGVPQDYVSAHMWLNLAAAQGLQDAPKNRDMAARLMTPAQIAEAQKLAREWKPAKQPPQ